MTRPTHRDHVKSDEEWAFICWLNEAVQYGLVSDWEYEPRSFTLFEKQTYPEKVQLKTKLKEVERHLHAEAHYTPDFSVSLTATGRHALYNVFKPCLLTGNTNAVWVDVKGKFVPKGYNSSTTTFPLTRKIMYDKHRIWVAKVVPFYKQGGKSKGLFSETFAPHTHRWRHDRNKPTLSSCGKCCIDIRTYLNGMSQQSTQQQLF